MKTNYFTTKRVVTIGILFALIFVLSVTNIGIIDIRFIGLPFAVTILHIPVIVGAVKEGPIAGVILGLLFGAFSWWSAMYRPNLTSPFFLNPVVSILPRMLIGVSSYYIYQIFKNKNQYIKTIAATAVGTLTNTVLVLSMIFVFYAENLGGGAAAATALGLTAVTNGIPELIFSIMVCTPILIIRRR